MSLPHTLLGLIHYKPATGYEIKNIFSRSVNFFWNATLPQIYRTLTRMEKKGWLQATTEQQDGKPNRKVYNITADGLSEFQRWLAESTQFPGQNNPMLPKLFFGNDLDPGRLAAHLTEWRAYHETIMGRLKNEGMAALDNCAENPERTGDVTFWKLALEFGLMRNRMVIDWCNHALEVLAKQSHAGQESPDGGGSR